MPEEGLCAQHDEDLANLQREIKYQQAVLNSIEGFSGDEATEQRDAIKITLNHLRNRVQELQSPPTWGSSWPIGDDALLNPGPYTPTSGGIEFTDKHDADFGISEGSAASQPSSSYSAPGSHFARYGHDKSPFLKPPNCSGSKRPFGFNDDEDVAGPREAKSRRTTPSPAVTAPTTPSSTSDSLDFDYVDPILKRLLGEDVKETMKENRIYEKELRRKKEQEEADAAYARQVQESLDRTPGLSARPPSMYQATLNPQTGEIRSMPPPPRPATKADMNQMPSPSLPGPSMAPTLFVSEDFPSPISLVDSDSDLEEISAAEFSHRSRPVINSPSFYTQQSNKFSATPGFPMPGSFPFTPYYPPGTLYTGSGGSSVYGLSDPFGLNTARTVGVNSVIAAMEGPGGLFASDGYPFDADGLRNYRDSLYSDPTKTEEEIKELLKQIRPDEDLDPKSREGTPPQLRCNLMEHQKLGLAWMKKMEEGSNRGGILADDMGLGKTIQALALIVSRPSDDPARKTNLIVAPVALMLQWKREIEKIIRSRDRLSVHILHGDNRATSWSDLRQYDVVLTTYGMIASELKRKHKWEEKVKTYPNARPSGKEDYCPVLGDTSKWYRVILDEAQAIKNKATKAAVGCSIIQGQYRWCLSGTPMQNNVTELFSLIHFLRIKPYCVAEKFSADFTRPLKSTSGAAKERAMRQLQALLKAILLRRTKFSKIDGAPLIQLPPKTAHERRAVFCEDEREFYKALETKSQLKFNKFLRAGTVGRNYSNILVLLLRLRQACCHPHLIKDFAIHTGGPAGLDVMANARELPPDVVERLKQIDAFECPICMDAVPNPMIFNPCGHSLCEECLARLTDQALGNDETGGKIPCPHCRSQIDTNKITNHVSFKKVFCPGEVAESPPGADEEGAESDTDSESEGDDDDDDDDGGGGGGDLENFVVPDDDPIEYDTDNEKEELPRSVDTPFIKKGKSDSADEKPETDRKSKGKSRSADEKPEKDRKSKGKFKQKPKQWKTLAQLRKEGLGSKAAKKKYLKRLKKDWQPSAKIDKTMELLEMIHDRGKNEKTIIFSGFTSFLDLIEVPISRRPELGSYTRYDGSMTASARNDSVVTFSDNPHCTIMLVSLKAGNSGLNLTAASQVIILDPHWNGYVEAQAVDRSHRIGQQRPVEVHRVLIDHEGLDADGDGNATVEDRILRLQEKKRELVEGALDENAGKNVARLGTRELGFLFGVNSI